MERKLQRLVALGNKASASTTTEVRVWFDGTIRSFRIQCLV